MLYKRSQEAALDPELFRRPTSEYRGAPFWAWNCRLDEATLRRQIGYLQEMGFGGFHMHSRTGMATSYLSDDFLSLVKACADEAEARDMLAWLYDEDRWPSGFAGGLVTRDPRFRQRTLVMSTRVPEGTVSPEESTRTGAPCLLARYDVELNPDGTLARARRDPNESVQGTLWYAYVRTDTPCGWFNNQTYVDTLSKAAIDRFIEITYTAYERAVGDRFDRSVPAIFTDEPQFSRKNNLRFPESTDDVTLPWTMDLPETYRAACGLELLDILPQLLWDLPDGRVSRARYAFHDHVTERFVEAFADNCGGWCAQHGLKLTGHIVEEQSLRSQTASVGDAMRSYRSFQIPGIDMLCNNREYTTAKQAQSAVHQYGREGMMSELYGVTNWDFDFRGHKFQGDWQAALGVTVRVPHLSWVSMGGNAKRDYPASINYQSPWYREYAYVEDHFARVNTALTRGEPAVDIAVVHPVESYWLHWGPEASTDAVREQVEARFQDLTRWLLFGQLDFDFLSESLLPEQCDAPGAPLQVGAMRYGTVIVPACETLRRSTLDILRAFQAQGGRLLFLGEPPRLIDAEPCDDAVDLYRRAQAIPFDRQAVLAALQPVRTLEIRNRDGRLADNLLYQLRRDGADRWLFIAHGVPMEDIDIPRAQEVRITIQGAWTPVLYDTLTGDIRPLPARREGDHTLLEYTLYEQDSLLLKLEPAAAQPALPAAAPERRLIASFDYKTTVPYTRAEPNALLLDIAAYALDDGPYRPDDEILRIDEQLRQELPACRVADTQPWVIPEEEPQHVVHLRFTIASEIEAEGLHLALEGADRARMEWNGAAVPVAADGYYVDEAIATVPLPRLRRGENTLVLHLPISSRTRLEWCYLLGDFGVRVEGCLRTIVPPTHTIGFGSITDQGLPYYGGNLTYRLPFTSPGGTMVVRANHYRGALIRAAVDGRDAGVIAYSPYRLTVGGLTPGEHVLELTLYGNRYNTFAALHNTDTGDHWYGPGYWYSQGDRWSYEHNLKETGILQSPVLEFYEQS